MAQDALAGWYARPDTPGRCYVRDGHAAVRFLDELSGELFRVRAGLIRQLRVDEDERAVRVDRMLAGARATREGRPGAGGDPVGATGAAPAAAAGPGVGGVG
jgi:hypothetical protein